MKLILLTLNYFSGRMYACGQGQSKVEEKYVDFG